MQTWQTQSTQSNRWNGLSEAINLWKETLVTLVWQAIKTQIGCMMCLLQWRDAGWSEKRLCPGNMAKGYISQIVPSYHTVKFADKKSSHERFRKWMNVSSLKVSLGFSPEMIGFVEMLVTLDMFCDLAARIILQSIKLNKYLVTPCTLRTATCSEQLQS